MTEEPPLKAKLAASLIGGLVMAGILYLLISGPKENTAPTDTESKKPWNPFAAMKSSPEDDVKDDGFSSTELFVRMGGHESPEGQAHFIYINSKEHPDEAAFGDYSRELCRGQMMCWVMFWDNRSSMPSSFPIKMEHEDSKVASYILNTEQGLDKVRLCSQGGC